MARFNTQDQFVFELLDQMQMQLDRHYYSMREAFLKVDTDRSGWLSKQEFNTILRMFNINVKDKELDALIAAFDANRDGKVSWTEFCNTIENGPWLSDANRGPVDVQDMEVEDVEPALEVAPQAALDFGTPPKSAPVPRAAPVQPPQRVSDRSAVLLNSIQRTCEQHFGSLQKAFLHIDSDRSGFISAQELIYLLYAHNVQVDWQDLRDLVALFDKNNDGLVSWTEFCEAMDKPPRQSHQEQVQRESQLRPPARPQPQAMPPSPELPTIAPGHTKRVHDALRKFVIQSSESMREAFVRINRSRSGLIDAHELEFAAQRAGVHAVTPEIIAELMAAYDLDRDGRLKFSEFVKAMSNNWVE